jgi:hypothetical protein
MAFQEHAQDGHAEAAGFREVADLFGGTACALCAFTLHAQDGHAVAAGFREVADSSAARLVPFALPHYTRKTGTPRPLAFAKWVIRSAARLVPFALLRRRLPASCVSDGWVRPHGPHCRGIFLRDLRLQLGVVYAR